MVVVANVEGSPRGTLQLAVAPFLTLDCPVAILGFRVYAEQRTLVGNHYVGLDRCGKCRQHTQYEPRPPRPSFVKSPAIASSGGSRS